MLCAFALSLGGVRGVKLFGTGTFYYANYVELVILVNESLDNFLFSC